jgi:hypothetical protein
MKFKLFVGILICLIYSLPTGANENKVVLAYVDYPPYYGKSLENGGPITEIIVQAYKQVGYVGLQTNAKHNLLFSFESLPKNKFLSVGRR